jgi:hypothetical protein
MLLCCAALAVLFVGNHERPGKAAAQVPGEAPSFLTDYVDAVRVGDWFLACVEATAPEERFQSATRNTTAPWVLLDERGDVLAEDLYWRPKDYPWPLQAQPFEGFEAGVDMAVLRVDQRYGLIDRAGKVVVEPVYDNLFGFKPGETACPAEKDGKWGCIDAVGNVIVPLLYDESFARLGDGRAVVTRDGREGLLGEDGSEILPAVYDVVWLEEGAPFGMARAGDTCALFERDGRILFERRLGENGWIFCNGDAEPPFACYNSVDQLRRIYAGEIVNWSDVGASGPGNIVAYQDEPDSEGRAAFDRLCGFAALADAPQGILDYSGWFPDANSGTVAYRNLPNALGYALLSRCAGLTAGGAVKLLGVDGVAPTDESIADGAYPFAETLFAVTRADNDNPNVRLLLDWLQSDQGRRLAAKAGFTVLAKETQG